MFDEHVVAAVRSLSTAVKHLANLHPGQPGVVHAAAKYADDRLDQAVESLRQRVEPVAPAERVDQNSPYYGAPRAG